MKMTTQRAVLVSGLVALGVSVVSLNLSQAQQHPITLPDIRTSHPPTEGTFSNSDLRGRYGFSFDGQIVEGPVVGPVAGIGWIDYDGAGNTTLAETLSLNGAVLQRIGTGTYQVNPDGTGTGSTVFTTVSPPGIPDIVATIAFVITNNRLEIPFVVTIPGVVVQGVSRKLIFP